VKILHVIPSLSPQRGGPTEVALKLVKALRESGVDAEIATTNDDGETLLDVPLYDRTSYQQVPVWFLPRFSPPLKEFIFSSALTQWLWQHIPTYDVLDHHYLFSYAPTCAATIARHHHVPYTVRTMGQLAPWALAQSRLKKQIYTALVERRNLEQAAVIHCTSIGEAADVRNFGIKTPTLTLPLGVELPTLWPDAQAKLRYTYSIAPEVPIVLFLSRLHYKKRPDLLLEALGQLAAQGHNFHLILAGSGDAAYVDSLTELTATLGLADRTTLPGFVTGTAKDLLLQGSDFFVLPSFSENFGIAVAEAMAAGLPVIVTPGVQIAPEIAAAKAGLVVDGLAPLVTALTQLLTAPGLRQQLGANGRQLVTQRYSWQSIAQSLASVYAEIAQLAPNSRYNQAAKV